MMKAAIRALAVMCILLGAPPILPCKAADIEPPLHDDTGEPIAVAGISWSGAYVGVHMGAGWGETQFSEPPGRQAIYGDVVQTPGPLGGGQIGFNYQTGPWVLGIEADASSADLEGTNTCLAYSGSVVSTNCREHIETLGTLTGRLGYALGDDGRTLLYVKGGAAWALSTSTITINHNDPRRGRPVTGSDNTQEMRWGWAAGGGIEYALSVGWSVNLEYDYFDLGSSAASVPTLPDMPGSISAAQSEQVVKVGLNYHFGSSADGGQGFPTFVTSVGGWDFEAGGRYWYSIGKFQKDLVEPALLSRLTYAGIIGNAEEAFGRIETPNNIFVKGVAGGSGLADGHMNDEDWGIPGPSPRAGAIPYSNTLSPKVDGSMSYGSVDVGYDLFRTPDYKLGAFVGYSRLNEKISAHGCTQIANPTANCAIPRPTTGTGITEEDEWDSVRLGLSGEFMLNKSLKLSFDAAWLPYTRFEGTDHHWNFTPTKIFSQSGEGDGVQIEGLLSYAVTDRFSLGVGGRFWSFKTTDSSYSCRNCNGAGTITAAAPTKANAEEYGVLVQGSYKLGDDEALEPLK
jgi:opacity protein-like surface antigen